MLRFGSLCVRPDFLGGQDPGFHVLVQPGPGEQVSGWRKEPPALLPEEIGATSMPATLPRHSSTYNDYLK